MQCKIYFSLHLTLELLNIKVSAMARPKTQAEIPRDCKSSRTGSDDQRTCDLYRTTNDVIYRLHDSYLRRPPPCPPDNDCKYFYNDKPHYRGCPSEAQKIITREELVFIDKRHDKTLYSTYRKHFQCPKKVTEKLHRLHLDELPHADDMMMYRFMGMYCKPLPKSERQGNTALRLFGCPNECDLYMPRTHYQDTVGKTCYKLFMKRALKNGRPLKKKFMRYPDTPETLAPSR